MNIHKRRIWDADGRCTSEQAYVSRRRFLGNAGVAVGGLTLSGVLGCDQKSSAEVARLASAEKALEASMNPQSGNAFVRGERNPRYTLDRPLTGEKAAATYNNFYEFTMSKHGVWRLAQSLKTHPWTIELAGEVKQPRTLDFDEIVKKLPSEERLYRLRCVEAWSMAVPWMGIPFKAFMDWVEPTSHAKYVRFVTFNRPKEAVGQAPGTAWNWPYFEGLTIAEAANELTLLATGIYGHALPKQHGAPVRMVLPWKYGYKSIKSLVKIEFVREKPHTFWNDAVPAEYGFYANVNPKKPHPRWSQATERMLETSGKRPTLPYNGYGEFVHDLYKGTPEAA